MLGSLAALVIRRRVTFLALVGVFVVVAAALGGNVAKHLSSGGFNDPGAPSQRAENELRSVFHSDQPNLIQTLKKGDEVTIDPTQIDDWMIKSGDKLEGGFTENVLMKRH